jgi:hypothetical protein
LFDSLAIDERAVERTQILDPHLPVRVDEKPRVTPRHLRVRTRRLPER